MNPLRWLATRLSGYAAKATSRPLAFVAGWLSNLLWLFDTTWVNLVKKGYGQNAVVYACMRKLCEGVAEPHLKAYQKGATAEDRQELPEDSDLMRLIQHPNELLTEYEMIELMTIHLSVVGRTTWWKERSVGGQVIGLWPLRPDRVAPVYSPPGETRAGQRVVLGYAYLPPDTQDPILIPRRDVLAVNFPDPDGESGGMVEGFGPLCAIFPQVVADNAATNHVGSLLANYAQPGIALEMENGPDSEEGANLIKAKFRQEFGGQRLGVPAIVGAGTKIIQIGFNLRDLEFPSLRDNAEARITAAFGVPAVLVGVRVGLSEANQRATVQELKEHFTETTLTAYWRRYGDQFTLELASEFGEGIVCDFDTSTVKALAGQFQKQIQPWKEAFAAGVITRNQYLSHLKLETLPPEYGDVFLVPNSVTVTPATDKARAALDKRAADAQAKLEEQQQKQRAQQIEDEERRARLNPPPAVPALPPGRQGDQPEEEEPEPPAARPVNGTNGKAPAKALLDDLVIIPLDEELAQALGVDGLDAADGTKYNPYHDARGRFTHGGAGVSVYIPKPGGQGFRLDRSENPLGPAPIEHQKLSEQEVATLLHGERKPGGKRKPPEITNDMTREARDTIAGLSEQVGVNSRAGLARVVRVAEAIRRVDGSERVGRNEAMEAMLLSRNGRTVRAELRRQRDLLRSDHAEIADLEKELPTMSEGMARAQRNHIETLRRLAADREKLIQRGERIAELAGESVEVAAGA